MGVKRVPMDVKAIEASCSRLFHQTRSLRRDNKQIVFRRGGVGEVHDREGDCCGVRGSVMITPTVSDADVLWI